jgi:hypothetical protein
MRTAGISAATLGKLAGISPTSTRDALRDEVYLGSEKEARLLETASRVSKFREALEPLDLPKEVSDLDALLKTGRTPEEVESFVKQIFEKV